MKSLILICLFISWAESVQEPPIHAVPIGVRNYIYDHMKVTEFPAMDYLSHKPDIRIGHKFRKLIGRLSRIVSRMLELQGKTQYENAFRILTASVGVFELFWLFWTKVPRPRTTYVFLGPRLTLAVKNV